jgi:putative transposase
MGPICRVLPIAPSTYHAHAALRADPGKLPARARSDAALMVEIRRVFEENFHVYGVRKVWQQLDREGIAVARCTFARLMQVMELQGRKVRTTIPDPAAACPLDRVNRQFKAPHPNALWVSDFTYVATDGGSPARLTPPSCSTRWNRPCTNTVLFRAAGSCTIATGGANILLCATRSG